MTDLQPGAELDALFCQIEGAQVRQVTDEMGEWVQGRILALPGDYVIDGEGMPRLCPAVSEDDATALAALERFSANRGVWWTITRFAGRYSVALHGDMMPIYAQTAATLAHAIVLAMLATVEAGNE